MKWTLKCLDIVLMSIMHRAWTDWYFFLKIYVCLTKCDMKIIHNTDLACVITLNYCTYTNHVGVSPRALYCVVEASYGLGRSLGHCRPALPKGRKYQMVKTQTQSQDRRPVVYTNRWQIWVLFSFELLWGTANFVTQAFGDSPKLSSTGLAIQWLIRRSEFIASYKKYFY